MAGQFLDIEIKEDTAAKLAAADGKPTKNYLFASEVNLMVDRIRTLQMMIMSANNAIGSIIDSNPKINLGTITEDFVNLLNLLPSASYEVPTFVLYKVGTTNYVQMFVGLNGDYGTETPNVLTADDFVLIYESDVATPTQTRELRIKLTQTGSDFPTYTISKNDGLFANVVRGFAGVYVLYLIGYPSHEKVHAFIGASEYINENQRVFIDVQDTGDNISISINTQSLSGGSWTNSDDILLKTSLHIIVDE